MYFHNSPGMLSGPGVRAGAGFRRAPDGDRQDIRLGAPVKTDADLADAWAQPRDPGAGGVAPGSLT